MEKKREQKGVLSAEDRILKAAAEVFSEKGYDAAGVEEIAKRADVTKPLIYYYFKGKQTILERLVTRFVERVIEEKSQYILSLDVMDKKMLSRSFEDRGALSDGDDKVLKVIAMELLKEKPACGSLPELIRPMVDTAMPKFAQLGLNEKDRLELIITGLFFGTVPTLALALFADSFCDIYSVEKKELYERFNKIVKTSVFDQYLSYFADEPTADADKKPEN